MWWRIWSLLQGSKASSKSKSLPSHRSCLKETIIKRKTRKIARRLVIKYLLVIYPIVRHPGVQNVLAELPSQHNYNHCNQILRYNILDLLEKNNRDTNPFIVNVLVVENCDGLQGHRHQSYHYNSFGTGWMSYSCPGAPLKYWHHKILTSHIEYRIHQRYALTRVSRWLSSQVSFLNEPNSGRFRSSVLSYLHA